jgi:hypothetical protein
MIKGNEPINSIPDLNNHPSPWIGLTKREYFAAMAMQGYCVNNDTIGVEYALIALWSVQQADALIKALNEIQP